MKVELLFCSLVLFASVSLPIIQGKVYTKCGLTQELLRIGFSRSLVGHWVCLIESESSRNTSQETKKANGGTALGIFQINSKEWCKYGSPGGKCNMKCEDLLNENIKDDATCAQKVQSVLGFNGWEGWIRSCKGRTYPATITSACAK